MPKRYEFVVREPVKAAVLLEELERGVCKNCGYLAGRNGKLEQRIAEVDALREAAQDYIERGHFLDCKALRVDLKNPRCTCGYDALAALLDREG